MELKSYHLLEMHAKPYPLSFIKLFQLILYNNRDVYYNINILYTIILNKNRTTMTLISHLSPEYNTAFVNWSRSFTTKCKFVEKNMKITEIFEQGARKLTTVIN